ncbi:MAG: sulfatase-like hydrolase/transferase [Verrucomicrobiae bacterium]|nr:sulfatase-like hydrolase/transferase [Verrucomicrobiae bacterium]
MRTPIVLFLLSLVGWVFSAGNVQADDRPNILWIMAEDISPFFGCYGNPDADTPTLDKYAKSSHLFLNAWTTAPICAPSRSCLATGMYQTGIGTQNLRSEVPISDKIQPLASVFRKNGYWTALRNKSDYNFSADGLFDYHEDEVYLWQHAPRDKPFFAFLNIGATHEGPGNISERAAPAVARLDKARLHDPDKVHLPPYYPDTPEMRRIWARYHDLISVWDMDIKDVLDTLKADGRDKDTIVFIMADHGLGLPRYKRWLYRTGMHVPLMIHIPEKFRAFSPSGKASSREEHIVSFVDLPATALTLAGIKVPDIYQGSSIFQKNAKTIKQRDYVFGARDRADDMYDLSRSVSDGRYIYIRHFMPHLPPIQEGIIFSPTEKESLVELHRIHDAGKDTRESIKLWSPRPYEELYDLQKDPWELNNVANDPDLSQVKQRLASELRSWLLDIKDSAFLTEPEMHRRAQAAGLKVYDMLQDDKLYPFQNVLNIAEMASMKHGDGLEFYSSSDPAVRYWALMAAVMADKKTERMKEVLTKGLSDSNAVVRTTAAEGLARMGEVKKAIPVFRSLLHSETEPNMGLFVARAVALSMDDARPLEKDIRETRATYLAPPGSPRPWKDFMYSAFSSWALEWALIKSGLNDYDDF